MKIKRISILPWKYLALASAAALSFGPAVQAAIQLDFVYDPVSGTTTATYSGTFNTGQFNAYLPTASHSASGSNFYNLDAVATGYALTTNSAPSGFAWQNAGTADSYSGTVFGFDKGSVYGPMGFTSSTVFAGSMTWNKDLTAMGFDSGELALGGGTYSGTGGTVNWTVSGGAAVPEPSTYALLSGGLILGVVAMRRRPLKA